MSHRLDQERVYIQCPRCRFYARPFLRQIRRQETIICGGCKANIALIDYLGQYRKAERRMRRALGDLRAKFGRINLTIKL